MKNKLKYLLASSSILLTSVSATLPYTDNDVILDVVNNATRQIELKTHALDAIFRKIALPTDLSRLIFNDLGKSDKISVEGIIWFRPTDVSRDDFNAQTPSEALFLTNTTYPLKLSGNDIFLTDDNKLDVTYTYRGYQEGSWNPLLGQDYSLNVNARIPAEYSFKVRQLSNDIGILNTLKSNILDRNNLTLSSTFDEEFLTLGAGQSAVAFSVFMDAQENLVTARNYLSDLYTEAQNTTLDSVERKQYILMGIGIFDYINIAEDGLQNYVKARKDYLSFLDKDAGEKVLKEAKVALGGTLQYASINLERQYLLKIQNLYNLSQIKGHNGMDANALITQLQKTIHDM